MEFYVTERDRELFREWAAPYPEIRQSPIALERGAELIAQVRQEERAAIRDENRSQTTGSVNPEQNP